VLIDYLTKLRARPALLRRSVSNLAKWFYRKLIVRTYKIIRKYTLAFVPFRMPDQVFLSPQADFPDYIVWGVIDWHFRYQRPQQLAKVLAESGRRVFYISSNFQNDVRAGFNIESLDANGRLFQVRLHAKTPKIIYFTSPSAEMVEQLRGSLGQLLLWAQTRRVISFVQHSFWYDIARVVPNSRLVYDCLDQHEGFGNNSSDVLSLERRLLKDADLTITTSARLDEHVAQYTQNRMLIRNACDFEHFSNKPEGIYSDSKKRRIIGYYGAIANWLDLDLIESVALHFTNHCILLIGADTVGAQLRLAHLNNVVFIGEVPYSNLPFYLYAFDVAILPFKIIPLTLATNPVKVYEYLAAGRPVVSVNLPETTAFNNLIGVANSAEEFILSIGNTLNSRESQLSAEGRQRFARLQTWRHRAEVLMDFTEDPLHDPLISIVVVTYNNLDLTRACLRSIECYSDYSNIEIIVVDNASSDETGEFLNEWITFKANRRIILNDTNKGFSAANNQGLSIARGEYLVMLNNDTYVTPGWLRTLYRHLKHDNSIGLIGPVTNNIGNEAKIDLCYQDMDGMRELSAEYGCSRLGKLMRLRTLAFFCVMMPREIYEIVGPLDEIFGLGFFEDDDYCRRVEMAGFRIVCADDVFVHHHHSASFLKVQPELRRALFNENKLKYEAKWGPWKSHSPRRKDANYARK
jgi:GT2 family glycosyltransferase/glycosyltransferase involved in cell wall biosynthesis